MTRKGGGIFQRRTRMRRKVGREKNISEGRHKNFEFGIANFEFKSAIRHSQFEISKGPLCPRCGRAVAGTLSEPESLCAYARPKTIPGRPVRALVWLDLRWQRFQPPGAGLHLAQKHNTLPASPRLTSQPNSRR